MKKLVFIAALTLAACTASPAVAQMTIQEKQDKMCPVMAGLAAAIMEGRQLGISMIDMMNAPGSDNAQAKEISRSFVKMAYEKPRYSTKEYQKRAVEDFRDDISRMCYATK